MVSCVRKCKWKSFAFGGRFDLRFGFRSGVTLCNASAGGPFPRILRLCMPHRWVRIRHWLQAHHRPIPFPSSTPPRAASLSLSQPDPDLGPPKLHHTPFTAASECLYKPPPAHAQAHRATNTPENAHFRARVSHRTRARRQPLCSPPRERVHDALPAARPSHSKSLPSSSESM